MESSIQEYTDKWEKRWEKGIIPWDLGKPTPMLVHLFSKSLILDPTTPSIPRKALVPGAGTGYDVCFIGSLDNWSAVGLDISPTAISAAEKNRTNTLVSPERAKFILGDFFELSTQGEYDLIFDHTFLCALLPSLRESWAQQMAKLIKPGGILIAYMYPIGDHTDGPPFAVSPDLYRSLLSTWFKEEFVMEIEEKLTRKTGEYQEKISKWVRLSV